MGTFKREQTSTPAGPEEGLAVGMALIGPWTALTQMYKQLPGMVLGTLRLRAPNG